MTWWAEHPNLAFCLRPLSWVYWLGWRLKRALAGSPTKLSVPVISVGNLSVGGTGKSPLVQALAKKALKAGKRPAVLLRGYGAAAGPRPLSVSASSLAVASGDEAREHALAGPWAVWVDADRRRSGQAAIAAGAQVLVLDDGFQRRHQVARDLDLLLADWAQIQAGEQLLPAGPWREPWSQLAQADAMLISGAPVAKDWAQSLPSIWRSKPLFRLDLEPVALSSWPSQRTAPLSRLRRRKVAALSGLGNPGRFEAALTGLGAQVLPWRFRDHHPFSAPELAAVPAGAELIVTTRKDAQRLPASWRPSLPVLVLKAEAKVSPRAPFEALVSRHV